MKNTILKAPTIFIRHVFLSYDDLFLFNNLDLTLEGGKCSCFLGPSGIGKSTLFKIICNLIPFQGSIYSDNHQLPHEQVAYMGQSDLLLPWLNALDNALLGVTLSLNSNHHHARNKALELFNAMGLKEALEKFPTQLSGGMRQRVALIRTILQEQPLVLMDEPFSSLDAITRYRLQTITAPFLENKTVLFITHDPMEALRLADDIYILGGQPTLIQHHLSLKTPKPRRADNLEIIKNQMRLFELLGHTEEFSA